MYWFGYPRSLQLASTVSPKVKRKSRASILMPNILVTCFFGCGDPNTKFREKPRAPFGNFRQTPAFTVMICFRLQKFPFKCSLLKAIKQKLKFFSDICHKTRIYFFSFFFRIKPNHPLVYSLNVLKQTHVTELLFFLRCFCFIKFIPTFVQFWTKTCSVIFLVPR
jgi:hypothetical protein